MAVVNGFEQYITAPLRAIGQDNQADQRQDFRSNFPYGRHEEGHRRSRSREHFFSNAPAVHISDPAVLEAKGIDRPPTPYPKFHPPQRTPSYTNYSNQQLEAAYRLSPKLPPPNSSDPIFSPTPKRSFSTGLLSNFSSGRESFSSTTVEASEHTPASSSASLSTSLPASPLASPPASPPSPTPSPTPLATLASEATDYLISNDESFPPSNGEELLAVMGPPTATGGPGGEDPFESPSGFFNLQLDAAIHGMHAAAAERVSAIIAHSVVAVETSTIAELNVDIEKFAQEYPGRIILAEGEAPPSISQLEEVLRLNAETLITAFTDYFAGMCLGPVRNTAHMRHWMVKGFGATKSGADAELDAQIATAMLSRAIGYPLRPRQDIDSSDNRPIRESLARRMDIVLSTIPPRGNPPPELIARLAAPAAAVGGADDVPEPEDASDNAPVSVSDV